jgi:hypothetical protein
MKQSIIYFYNSKVYIVFYSFFSKNISTWYAFTWTIILPLKSKIIRSFWHTSVWPYSSLTADLLLKDQISEQYYQQRLGMKKWWSRTNTNPQGQQKNHPAAKAGAEDGLWHRCWICFNRNSDRGIGNIKKRIRISTL